MKEGTLLEWNENAFTPWENFKWRVVELRTCHQPPLILIVRNLNTQSTLCLVDSKMFPIDTWLLNYYFKKVVEGS